ncbi:MAG: valine--tRNA ligase, partial [Desulfobacteraceae bacterium]
CHTALADLEVEHEEIDSHLYYIRYPLPDGSGSIVIATTRPETMLGDTAVAVNPEDPRYQNLGTDSVILPLLNRKIPIITDNYVDMAFGTGALKVTPAHDPNDFEIGKRHNLPEIKVIDDNGKMTSEAGRFEGLDRFKCRESVLKALKKEGLLEKMEPIKHNVGHCYRCKTIVEPNLSKQWFVKVKPLAEKAIDAVENGSTKIVPEIWTNTYFDWMRNIKDWCISRQIWWGHQIPAWTCEKCGHLIVSMETPSACSACGSDRLIQETDVLDTWFSSALWPFSTMGWPEKTQLLKTFYPTSVLVTGFDILFFWVARMMMMGIHFMENVPFRDVYVHALVRDEEGKKMSKSKGNVIDPLNIIDNYGTDAFRMTLAAFAAQGRDIKMSEKRVEGYRHFINKLWNAGRFSFMHLNQGYTEIKFADLSLPDKWILARLKRVTDSVACSIDSYRFNDAAGTLYKFVWHELCDWYLEAVKPCLYGNKGEEKKNAALSVLWRVLHDTLILLHPFIPFVTEEIWHKLPGTKGSIMKAVFPSDEKDFASLSCDPESEPMMELIIEIITGIRNIRGEMNISPSSSIDVVLQSDNMSLKNILSSNEDIVINLAGLKSFSVEKPGKRHRKAAMAVVGDATIHVSLEGIIDFSKEKERLEKELAKLKDEIGALVKKLGNDDFLSKAPAEIVEKVREKHQVFIEKQQKLTTNLDKIRSIEAS